MHAHMHSNFNSIFLVNLG